MVDLTVRRHGGRRLFPVTVTTAAAAALGFGLSPARAASVATTDRVSVSSTGTQGDNGSAEPSISAVGGSWPSPRSRSTVAANDTNAAGDVFVYDTSKNKTRHFSVSSTGTQGNDFKPLPVDLSRRAVPAFQSTASNLVGNDTNLS